MFIYLFGYFLIADAVNTAFMLVVLCQSKHFAFSFLQQTYFGVLTSTSIATFQYVQRRWDIDAKKMVGQSSLCVCVFV